MILSEDQDSAGKEYRDIGKGASVPKPFITKQKAQDFREN